MKAAHDAFIEIANDDPSQLLEYGYRLRGPCSGRAMWAATKDLEARLANAGGFGPIAAARKTTVQAGIAALEGRSVEALQARTATGCATGADARKWDEALTGIDMAKLLDPDEPEVAEVIGSTRASSKGCGRSRSSTSLTRPSLVRDWSR